MEMSYLHMSLVHSASTSSGLPEAAGCFARVYSHSNRGATAACALGSDRAPPNRWEAPGSPLAASPLAAEQPAGNCSLLGVLKADTGERAEEARSPGGHGLPQAQVPLDQRL